MISIAYLAGLVDGEGSVLLEKTRSGFRRPALSVASTCLPILDWVKSKFGGCVPSSRKRDPRYRSEKIAHSWHLANDSAILLMKRILPHMHEPRKIARIQHILTHYKKCTPRNGQYSPQMLVAKMKFEEDFFTLTGDFQV